MAISYSIKGGADAAKFNIDPTTGALTFKAAPDFEKPGDANADNIYEVDVCATDAGGLYSVKPVKVTVTDVSEGSPPQITSAGAISVKENQTTVMTITATDPDDGTPPEPPTGAFDLASLPFAATSLWNKPIPSGKTYTQLNWVPSDGWNYGVTWTSTGYPVYQSRASDPMVLVTTPSWGWPPNPSLRVPVGVTGWPGAGNPPDNPILVIDDKNVVHNFWQFVRKTDTTATAGAYGKAHAINDSGFGSGGYGAGTNAIGASMLGGLLVQKNTDTGDIKHVLQLAVAGEMLKPGYVPPAISSDGHSSSGIVQEGQLLAIPANVAMPSGLSPLGQKVYKALQQYGAYVCDHGGGGTFLRAQANAYDQTTIDKLWTDLNTVLRMLQAVS